MYTARGHRTGYVSCFVSRLLFVTGNTAENTCIVSCAIFAIGANSPLNESNEELRGKHLCFSVFFKIMQSKQR